MELNRKKNFTRREALGFGLLASATLLLPLERTARTQLATASRLTSKRLLP